MSTFIASRMLAATLITVAGIEFAKAEDAHQADIEALRQAMVKYEDPYVAVRDLYLSTVGCVHYDGSTMEGHLSYAKGAMGIHFVNLTVQGPPDPLRPNVLVYEPQADGSLKLVAVEWLVPLAAATERPSIFGQPFQGPMEGHEPLIPAEFLHYDLHLWLIDNPEGMFSPTNPNVTCEHAQFGCVSIVSWPSAVGFRRWFRQRLRAIR
jgi:hypothetical protein